MGRKRYSSKFDSRLTELVHALSLDGGPDEQVGSSTEAPGTWAGLMRGGRQMAQALRADPKGYDIDQSDAKELKQLEELAGVIMTEDGQGFVGAEGFEDGDELEAAWEKIEAELGADEDEEYEDREDDEEDSSWTDVPDEEYLGNARAPRGDFRSIRAGMRVTIMTPQRQERTGRAVMLGPSGWVLNMGGAHGTPGIATEQNFVRVSGRGAGAGERLGGMRSNARAISERWTDFKGKRQRVTIAEITHAEIRYYSDNHQETVYISWIGSDGKAGRTEGPQDNPHIEALLARARREGVPVRKETW